MNQQTPEAEIAQKVLNASLPKHDSFEPFIFNDKPDKPLGWDESIEWAQANYCDPRPHKDNTRERMREKAISAWSFQAGCKLSHTRISELEGEVERLKKALGDIDGVCQQASFPSDKLYLIRKITTEHLNSTKP